MSDNTSVGGPDDGKEQYPPEEDLSDLVEKHDKATNNFYERW